MFRAMVFRLVSSLHLGKAEGAAKTRQGSGRFFWTADY
jgi:hypothetical protein